MSSRLVCSGCQTAAGRGKRAGTKCPCGGTFEEANPATAIATVTKAPDIILGPSSKIQIVETGEMPSVVHEVHEVKVVCATCLGTGGPLMVVCRPGPQEPITITDPGDCPVCLRKAIDEIQTERDQLLNERLDLQAEIANAKRARYSVCCECGSVRPIPDDGAEKLDPCECVKGTPSMHKELGLLREDVARLKRELAEANTKLESIRTAGALHQQVSKASTSLDVVGPARSGGRGKASTEVIQRCAGPGRCRGLVCTHPGW